MATQIPYETLVELAQQLPLEQRLELIRRLQQRPQPDLDRATEKIKRLKEAQLSVTVDIEPSIRRQDWYVDDGR